MTQVSKGTALITGASTGIGSIYADRLAKRGYDLILVARRIDKLETLAAKITETTGRKVAVVAADLTKGEDVRRIEEILKTDASITALVNNAGTAGILPLVASKVDEMEEMIKLNVTALTRLTYAAAPAFAARGNGAIINISSIVAIATEVLNGVYGASKAFVLSFSQSLQHELSASGVRVQAVLPGATATDLWALAGKPVENLPSEIVMSADDMVDAALKGFDAGEVVTIPSLHDGDKWTQYEAARRELSGLFGNSKPANRYL